ncbi:MAG: hypothetical protein JW749_12615 [Sedimentisphaerales bacterium]|nr:hypothetical protein [Sedimentisphaerales bacterium]
MRTKALKLIISVLICMPVCSAIAVDGTYTLAFAGRDVHIKADKLTSFRGNTPDFINVLVVEKGFEIHAGADTFKGDKAIVWLKQSGTQSSKSVSVWCYVSGKISAARSRGPGLTGLNWKTIEDDKAMVIWFEATGEVFTTSKSRGEQSVRIDGNVLYDGAFAAVASADKNFAISCESVAPGKLEDTVQRTEDKRQTSAVRPRSPVLRPTGEHRSADLSGAAREKSNGVFGFIENILGTTKRETPGTGQGRRTKVRYPINLAPAGETEPNVEMGLAAGEEIATVIGRFYLWQKQDEQGGLLEMQADAAVVFYTTQKSAGVEGTGGIADLGTKGAIEAIYVCGDVVMTEGLRSIRADELFYDFTNKSGLAVNATLRNFDVGRGIPIYVRAAEIRRLAEDKFSANNVVLTTSEFAEPQVSMQVSSIFITDSTAFDREPKDSSYDVQMQDARLKTDSATIFRWPYFRGNLERPDVAIKSMRIGNDNIFGTSVESRWYLSRLLGLQEPDGTNETFDLDYYSKRGVGAGIDVDYKQESRLGRIAGYLINDNGEDRLGRVPFRRDLEPAEDTRGRFSWVHRQFLPYNWQLTTGINYESDENFVESFYRREFNTGPDRETYIHLKRIEDNWGLSLLGKGRLNDFADELEEYPTGEYHLTGQSIFDDKMTLYSDTQAGQFRQRTGNFHNTAMDEKPFVNVSHRTELDLPIWTGGAKATPFVACTVGYDDRSGFSRLLVDGSDAGSANEDVVSIGEAGVRVSTEYWRVFKGVHSRLWDIDGLRHIVRPEMAATVYAESDPVIDQHNVIHLGLSQRLQTKRGQADKQKTVDWMRLDLGATWFADNEPRAADSGPFRFIWNRPMTPLRLFTMPTILNGDLPAALKKIESYGPQRDYLIADFLWQISDTTALLSDAFYDIHEGTIEQLNVGFSRSRWPDFTYYIGSRYLRNVHVLDEHGSNAFIFAASYNIDERYTVIFSQQYDFDYAANVENNITLIRRYHRVFWSLTVGADTSLDRKSIMFSIWPQGIPELALGSRRYTGMVGPGEY